MVLQMLYYPTTTTRLDKNFFEQRIFKLTVGIFLLFFMSRWGEVKIMLRHVVSLLD